MVLIAAAQSAVIMLQKSVSPIRQILQKPHQKRKRKKKKEKKKGKDVKLVNNKAMHDDISSIIRYKVATHHKRRW